MDNTNDAPEERRRRGRAALTPIMGEKRRSCTMRQAKSPWRFSTRLLLAVVGAGVLGLGGPVLATSAAGAAAGPVVISSPTSPTCTGPSSGCTSLVLTPQGPLPSTFITTTVPITVTNNATPAASKMVLSVSAGASHAGGPALEDGIDLCLHERGKVIANGPLTRGIGVTPSITIKGVGRSTTLDLSFYAGKDSACGHVASTTPSNAAIWSTPVGTGSYVTPSSLNNPAEGGSVTVTLGFDLAATVAAVTAGSTGTGTGSGTHNPGTSTPGSSMVPVQVATASVSGRALAFTGFDVALFCGGGTLLLLAGFGLLAWRRRLGARR